LSVSNLEFFNRPTHSYELWQPLQWRPFTQIYSTGVARVPTVVSGAFYYRLDVCNLCKLLFQTQFISNYPTIIIFYLHSNIPQVNKRKTGVKVMVLNTTFNNISVIWLATPIVILKLPFESHFHILDLQTGQLMSRREVCILIKNVLLELMQI
jgi:hypothetical protein